MTVIMSRLEGFDKSLEEASRDLGEDAWTTFWRVTLPLAWPGVVSSLLLCFITSFDEFVLAFFLSGTQPTLPVFLFSQLRFPNKLPGTLALGSLILMVSAVLVVIAEVIRRRGADDMRPGGL
jgi:spermidine/putrescine transport system permease protein